MADTRGVTREPSSSSSDPALNSFHSTSESAISPIPTSRKPPISWPSDDCPSLEWIHTLTRTFEWSSKDLPPSDFPSVLPVVVFDRLVLRASRILHAEPNCVEIDVESDEEVKGFEGERSVVVVGDVHGQFHDLLFLFDKAGLPSEERYYVFNGDYVDRGAWGLETFLLLLAWKVLLPRRVFLLRGNHESKYCTSTYGFEKEVMCKYGEQGRHVYRKCLGCFEGLPLASIICASVYTSHGGLFRSIGRPTSRRGKGKKGRKRVLVADSNFSSLTLGSLEELSKARRTVLNPPFEGLNLIPGDVLWSDPSPRPGLSPNKERGIGLLWGPDCTEEFLRSNNLKLIIRSHEGPDARIKRPGLADMQKGYTIDHEVESGKLITLFSAPDYPQFQATEDRFYNMGAYILLKPPDFATPEFHSFEAVKPRPKATAFYDYHEVIDSDEELNLESMAES